MQLKDKYHVNNNVSKLKVAMQALKKVFHSQGKYVVTNKKKIMYFVH